MKKIVFIICISLCSNAYSQNADTLMYERFETGGSSFTLNTPDVGSVSAAVGYNQWIVNNAYSGGSGSLMCLGFPFSFTIASTPAQPAPITGGANTGYMHIVSDAGQAFGIENACYLAADGICNFNENHFAKMTQDVNTTGYDSVTVSFLWISAGGTNIYGEFYYSSNGGSSWNLITTPISQYKNQSNWVQQSVTLPSFAGQPTLRFGFRFVNQTSTAANEPSFGIDEFLITAKVSSPPPVAAFSTSASEICEGTCVDFTDASTGAPTSWLWIFQGATTAFSTQQNPSQICYNNSGIYEVTLIVSNLIGSDTITFDSLIVYPTPSQPDITLIGDTLFATPGFTGYQWHLNGNIIPGADDDFYVVINDGIYTVTVTDTNGCSAESDPLNFTTGLSEQDHFSFSIYPNPATDFLQIVYPGNARKIVIYDIIGQVMYVNYDKLLPEFISLELFTKGIYFVKAYFDEGSHTTRKFNKM